MTVRIRGKLKIWWSWWWLRFSILGGGKTVDPRDCWRKGRSKGLRILSQWTPLCSRQLSWGCIFILWLSPRPKVNEDLLWPLPQWDLIRPSLWQTLWLNFDFCLNQTKNVNRYIEKYRNPRWFKPWPVYPLFGGHLTFPKGHVVFTSPTRSRFLAVGCGRVAAAVVLGKLQSTGCGWFTSGDSWMYPYLWVFMGL